jgi:hypothetical protein
VIAAIKHREMITKVATEMTRILSSYGGLSADDKLEVIEKMQYLTVKRDMEHIDCRNFRPMGAVVETGGGAASAGMQTIEEETTVDVETTPEVKMR